MKKQHDQLRDTLDLGERLARARKYAGLSQGEIADALDMSRVSVSNYERGLREPSFGFVVRWADVCRVDLEYFAAAELEPVSAASTTWFARSDQREESLPFPFAVRLEVPGQAALPFVSARDVAMAA